MHHCQRLQSFIPDLVSDENGCNTSETLLQWHPGDLESPHQLGNFLGCNELDMWTPHVTQPFMHSSHVRYAENGKALILVET
jgi:hypothetical protein